MSTGRCVAEARDLAERCVLSKLGLSASEQTQKLGRIIGGSSISRSSRSSRGLSRDRGRSKVGKLEVVVLLVVHATSGGSSGGCCRGRRRPSL